MKIAALLLCLLINAVVAFSPSPTRSATSKRVPSLLAAKAPLDKNVAIAAGFMASQIIIQSAQAVEEVEVVDLPPPYVPVIVGLFLLGGVGVLTSSLGNVMDEEASLGLQSGARAKKEMERSRSSYFKKR
jgi:hypothetical protein